MAAGGGTNVNMGAAFTGGPQINAFQAAMGAATATADKFALAIGALNINFQMFTQTITGANSSINNSANFNVMNNTLKNLGITVGDLTKAFQGLAVGAGAFSQTVTGNNSNLTNTINIYSRLNDATNRWFLSLTSVSRIIQAQVVARYTQAMFGNIDQTITKAADLDLKIAAIRTISQEAAITQAGWRMEIRRLSDEFGNPILDTVAGTYEAISNQVAKGEAATRFMAEAMLFAKTTLATTAESVSLLSSVINAYNLSSEDAGRISQVFFRTIELGRVTAAELANIFGPVATSAHLLGVKLEEVGAAEAILTSQGTKASTSLTLISNVINKLVKPSEDMKKLFHEWNVESGEAAISTFGFAGVIERLGDVVQRGGLTELSAVFKDIRGIRGAAGLTGGNILGDFATVLGQIKEESANYANAQKIMMESTGNKFKTEVNKMQNILTVDFGNAMLEFITRLLGGAGSATKVLQGLTTGIYSLTVATSEFIGTFTALFSGLDRMGISWGNVVISITAATLATQAFFRIMALGWVASPYLAAIAIISIAIISLYAHWIAAEENVKQKQLQDLVDMKKEFDKFHEARMDQINTELSARLEANEENSRNTNVAISAILGGWNKLADSIAATSGGLEKHLEKMTKFFDGIADTANKGPITELGKQFTNMMKDAGSTKVIDGLIKNLGDLRQATLDALSFGNIELAQTAFDKFKDNIKATQDSIEEIIKESIKRQKDSAKDFSERKFDLALDTMSGGKQKAALEAEVKKLIADAQTAQAGGNTIDAQGLLKRAEELAERETKRQQDRNKTSGGKKLDLSLEEQVAAANQAFEAGVQNVAKLKGQEIGRLGVEQEVSGELKKQLDLLNLQKSVIDGLMKARIQYNASTKELENIAKQTEELESQRDSVGKSFLTLAQQLQIATDEKNRRLKSPTGTANTEFGQSELAGSAKLTQQAADAAFRASEDLKIGVRSTAEILSDYESRMKSIGEGVKTFDKEGKPTTATVGIGIAEQKFKELIETEGKTRLELVKFNKSKNELDTAAVAQEKLRNEADKFGTVLQNYGKQNFPEEIKKTNREMAEPLKDAADKLKEAAEAMKGNANQAFPGLEKFNQGGVINGSGGFDNVIVKAMAGEGILHKQAMSRYYPEFKAMNAGTHQVNNSQQYNLHFNVQGGNTSEGMIRDVGFKLKRMIQRGQLPPLS